MIARLEADALKRALAQFPVVVLTGARQVGKTTLARWLLPEADYVSLDDPVRAEQARLTPSQFLRERTAPCIIDEVQYAPTLFSHLKTAVDGDRTPGRFLVTGSQTFGLMAGVSESLAGRAAIFSLPPLSIAEVTPTPSLAETDAFLWRSGYPELWHRPDLDRDLWMGSYVATYLERDVRQVLHVGDLREFDRFLRAAALRSGQLLSYAELARDVGIAPNTAKRWMSVLEASQQVFLLEPYHRQRTKRLIKSPKLYFSDAGLLGFLMGFRHPADLPLHALWGAVWESFVIAEVRKRLLAAGHPPPLWFWRTAHGDEVDLLIEIGPETFMAVECKATERVAAASLGGVSRLREEYGSQSVRTALVACRTDRAYPLESRIEARAVPVGGPDGVLEVAAVLSNQ
jgi:predicted AAA+ superfamily ATPase